MSTITLADIAETSKASKSSVPAIHDGTLAESVQQYVTARTEREKWEAIEESAAAQIREAGATHRRLVSQRARKVIATICLNGAVQVQCINKYSAIPGTLEEHCRDVMGPSFDKYLTETLGVTVRSDGVDMLQQLLDAVGPDRFREWFQITKTLHATAALHADLATDAAVYEQLRPLLEDRTLVPQSPTVKLA